MVINSTPIGSMKKKIRNKDCHGTTTTLLTSLSTASRWRRRALIPVDLHKKRWSPSSNGMRRRDPGQWWIERMMARLAHRERGAVHTDAEPIPLPWNAVSLSLSLSLDCLVCLSPLLPIKYLKFTTLSLYLSQISKSDKGYGIGNAREGRKPRGPTSLSYPPQWRSWSLHIAHSVGHRVEWLRQWGPSALVCFALVLSTGLMDLRHLDLLDWACAFRPKLCSLPACFGTR